jgi:hypothetical protein
MKTLPVVALFTLIASARSHHIRNVHYKRQTDAAAPSPAADLAPPAAGTGAAVAGVPPLTAINLSMPPGPTLAPTTTYAAGAIPPVSGAPPLPTPCAYHNPGGYIDTK